jgi:antitoxin component YwqK of YwqJK toxin-antitoxin module
MGQFKDDKKNGKGIFYHANGKVQQGMWSDDQFIG